MRAWRRGPVVEQPLGRLAALSQLRVVGRAQEAIAQVAHLLGGDRPGDEVDQSLPVDAAHRRAEQDDERTVGGSSRAPSSSSSITRSRFNPRAVRTSSSAATVVGYSQSNSAVDDDREPPVVGPTGDAYIAEGLEADDVGAAAEFRRRSKTAAPT
jgi:hypothetical protein